jgi:hypothetical protein
LRGRRRSVGTERLAMGEYTAQNLPCSGGFLPPQPAIPHPRAPGGPGLRGGGPLFSCLQYHCSLEIISGFWVTHHVRVLVTWEVT